MLQGQEIGCLKASCLSPPKVRQWRQLGFYGGYTVPETPNLTLYSLAAWGRGSCPVMLTIGGSQCFLYKQPASRSVPPAFTSLLIPGVGFLLGFSHCQLRFLLLPVCKISYHSSICFVGSKLLLLVSPVPFFFVLVGFYFTKKSLVLF